MIDVPVAVRAKALSVGADAWLEELPELVAGLSREWSVTLGPAYADATEAFVAPATQADGGPAVLKLLVPRGGGHAANEITALRLAGGAGCATLLRCDEERNALLLERLGPQLADLHLPITRRLEILSDVAGAVWRPAPDAGLPTGAQKGRWLIDFILRRWEELDRPCTERAVAHAVACAERRIEAHDDERAVLVHGDVHQWNTLRAAAGFKLVDPDGLLAEPEYDLGVLMREDPIELMAGNPWDRAHRLATRTGLNPMAIWEWGAAERVSTGLVLTGIAMPAIGGRMLAAADMISLPT
ncbi:MAG: aminoglycoside phosphotransferase family protein [Actinoplanes sp.]